MLLATKFMRPAADPRAVQRPQLVERLDRGPATRVTTLTAPAGYGKTTLVNQWCDITDSPKAWLSLDELDNDPQRFWSYVVGTLEKTALQGDHSIHRFLNDSDENSLDGAITALINAILEQDISRVTLVLDDYHLISDERIHRQLMFLIDHSPPALHIVLLSRTEPPLPLARWRVRGWLNEVHANDLAFSETECHQFFNDYMGLALDQDAIRQLWQRTEGWAAAMQLTALSQSGNEVSGAREIIEYGGDSKHISDYVLGEILDQQEPETRDFLLATSVCRRICASLADYMLKRDDSQSMLEGLVKRNLFIIPLDTRDQWFRYHDLFREALNHRLRSTDSERYDNLQARAIQWLLDQDQLQEAIIQLIDLQDWDWLEEVFEKHGNQLIHGGFHVLVHRWLEHLPIERLENNPRLLMLRIWALFFLNRLNLIDPLLERLEDLLDKRVAESHEDAEVALGLYSEIALIRSYMARTRSDLSSAQELTRQVLRDIDHTNIPLKSETYYGIGLDSYAHGDLESANAALTSAVEHGKMEKKHSTTLSSAGLLAWIKFVQGEMTAALEVASEARKWVNSLHQSSRRPRLISCFLNCSLAQIYREKNDLTMAQTFMQPMLPHFESGIEPGQHVLFQYTRAHIAYSKLNYDEAVTFLEDAENVIDHKRDAILFEPPSLESLHARCLIAQGNVVGAQALLERLESTSHRNPINREQSRIAIARIHLATGNPDAAMERLASLRLSVERGHHTKHLIELLALYASCLEAVGKQSEADTMLERALDLASRDMFLRLFHEEGAVVARIFHRMDKSRLPKRFVEELKELLPEPDTSPQTAAELSPGQEALVEPLSQRELEVLHLIHEGHANKAIAQRMGVAPATVKAHIRNLYGKLGVNSRTAALAEARRLGLLEPA